MSLPDMAMALGCDVATAEALEGDVGGAETPARRLSTAAALADSNVRHSPPTGSPRRATLGGMAASSGQSPTHSGGGPAAKLWGIGEHSMTAAGPQGVAQRAATDCDFWGRLLAAVAVASGRPVTALVPQLRRAAAPPRMQQREPEEIGDRMMSHLARAPTAQGAPEFASDSSTEGPHEGSSSTTTVAALFRAARGDRPLDEVVAATANVVPRDVLVKCEAGLAPLEQCAAWLLAWSTAVEIPLATLVF